MRSLPCSPVSPPITAFPILLTIFPCMTLAVGCDGGLTGQYSVSTFNVTMPLVTKGRHPMPTTAFCFYLFRISLFLECNKGGLNRFFSILKKGYYPLTRSLAVTQAPIMMVIYWKYSPDQKSVEGKLWRETGPVDSQVMNEIRFCISHSEWVF